MFRAWLEGASSSAQKRPIEAAPPSDPPPLNGVDAAPIQSLQPRSKKRKRLTSCEHSGCTILNPVFGVEGGKARFCGTHKEAGMVDVKSKRCEHDGCTSQPVFGVEGGKACFCGAHKEAGMVDVRHKRCEHDGCTSQPSYGVPGFTATLCAKHKEIPRFSSDGVTRLCIIRHPKVKCGHPGCKEAATHGIRQPQRCEAHRLPDDLNLVESPCASCGLVFRIDPVSRKCEYCDPKTRHAPRLAKQREVKQFLQHEGTVPPWTHYDEVPQELKQCGDRERPDFLWNDDGERGWCVILEVDEHQHQERPEFCECARMLNVSQDLGCFTLWIRFNPDKYKPAQGLQLSSKRRMESLALYLKESLCHIPGGVNLQDATCGAVLRLFFDGYDGTPRWEPLAPPVAPPIKQ